MEELLSEPYAFEFHQALRILERIRPGMPGETTLFDRETVRFSSWTSRAFPAAEIQALNAPATSEQPPTLVVNHLGLTGIHGVLPDFVTDTILRQRRQEHSPLQDFLDIFHHRLVALHARVRRVYRPTYINVPPEQSPSARIFFALMGLGLPSLRHAMYLADKNLLPFAGLLIGHRRTATAIRLILAEFTGCPISIIPYRAAWHRLDKRSTTCIGLHGRNATLGHTAICGRRAFDPIEGCTIQIGPCTAERYTALMPNGSNHDALLDLVRLLFRDAGCIALQLELKRSAVPAIRLGQNTFLGVMTWLAPHRITTGDNDTELRFVSTAAVYRWNSTQSALGCRTISA